MRDHVVSALTSRSRVSRVGSLIIVHAVLINQFFKRNNVGRCTYEYFFRFFFLIIAFFFIIIFGRDRQANVILDEVSLWSLFFSLSYVFFCFLFSEVRGKKRRWCMRFKYLNRWNIVLCRFLTNSNDFRIVSGRDADWREALFEYWRWRRGEAYEVVWENKQMSGLIRTKLRLKTRECFMRWCGKLSLLSW